MSIIATATGFASFQEGDGHIEVEMAEEKVVRLSPGEVIEMIHEGKITKDNLWRSSRTSLWRKVTDGYLSQEKYHKQVQETELSEFVVGAQRGKPAPQQRKREPDEVPLSVLAAHYVLNGLPFPDSVRVPPEPRTENKRDWEDQPASQSQIETLKVANLAVPTELTAGQASDWMALIRTKLELPDWRIPPTRIGEARADWKEEPATYGQKRRIASYGLTTPEGLTKGSASDWIQVLLHSKEAADAKINWDIREMAGRTDTSESYSLKTEADEYKKGGCAADARSWLRHRAAWWSNFYIKNDTKYILSFESPKTDIRSPNLLKLCSHLYLERLRALALRAPKRLTRSEIQSRLETLDASAPGWDRFKPHMFFE